MTNIINSGLTSQWEKHTLSCVVLDSKGNEIFGWDEELDSVECAEELFRRLLLVSNNFDYP
mgnify:CR=1 FL=1